MGKLQSSCKLYYWHYQTGKWVKKAVFREIFTTIRTLCLSVKENWAGLFKIDYSIVLIFVSDLRYDGRTGGCIGQGSPSSVGPKDHRPVPRRQSLGLYQFVARRYGLQCHYSSQSSRSCRVEKAWPTSSPREDWHSLPCHGERVWSDATSRSRR